jgi:hypothetical protein
VTNPVAVIGLTYDGTDVQANPMGVFLELVHGLNETGRVRGLDTIVPALGGRVIRNRVADGFTVELRGYVSGTGVDEEAQRANFRFLVNTLRALFDPTRDPADLVATLEDGSTATCSARPLPTMVWGDQIVPSMAVLSVELESGDEDWVIAASGS